MIVYRDGDLLTAETDALVNSVNCVGVMGRGVALAFKRRFPENYRAYAKACRQREVRLGRMFVYETGQVFLPRYIINFPTKDHWRAKSRMKDIVEGLSDLARSIRARDIRSIAIPALGSGLGGLPWPDVRASMEDALGQLGEVTVAVYRPRVPSSVTAAASSSPPRMTAGRAALVALLDRYLGAALDPVVTLLEVHKLMYFLQEAGEPLRLRYVKGPYGPYAENLRHVLSRIEGHLVSGSAGDGDLPGREIQLAPNALEDAREFLNGKPTTMTRIERVERLVYGFEDAFGMELLATVHWVIEQEGARDFDSTVNLTHTWSERKKHFTRRQIRIAADVLFEQEWCPPWEDAGDR